jgi:hypothetical protein
MTTDTALGVTKMVVCDGGTHVCNQTYALYSAFMQSVYRTSVTTYVVIWRLISTDPRFNRSSQPSGLMPTKAWKCHSVSPLTEELIKFADLFHEGYIKRKEGGPLMPPGMKELLHADLDKGFDF